MKIITLALILFIASSWGPMSGIAKAGSVPRSVERSLVRKLETRGVSRGYQKLGPLRRARRPMKVLHVTRHPSIDARRGLPRHSFVVGARRGRLPKRAAVRRYLNIPHRVTARETIVLPKGTRYHERPVRGGRRYQREKIIHDRVRNHHVIRTQRLPQ